MEIANSHTSRIRYSQHLNGSVIMASGPIPVLPIAIPSPAPHRQIVLTTNDTRVVIGDRDCHRVCDKVAACFFYYRRGLQFAIVVVVSSIADRPVVIPTPTFHRAVHQQCALVCPTCTRVNRQGVCDSSNPYRVQAISGGAISELTQLVAPPALNRPVVHERTQMVLSNRDSAALIIWPRR